MPEELEMLRIRVRELEVECEKLKCQRDQEKHQADVYRQQMTRIADRLSELQKKYDAIAAMYVKES